MKLLIEVARFAPYNCAMFDYIVVMTYKLLKRRWGIEIIIDTEREKNMHCHSIKITRSFYVSLTSAESQKLECFKLMANNIFMSAMKI